jgi:hypothetical protein
MAGLALTHTACSDYLDISSELTRNLSIDEVFENPTYTRSWYVNMYQSISEFSETGSEANAFRNPWSNMAGEITSQKMPSLDAMTAGYTAGTAAFHRWATLYQYIRQAMIFIERGKPVGSDSNIITEAEMARMKDEARYFLAYCYFSIFELYGPCPIVTVIDDAAYPAVEDYTRATVDEMVHYIDSLLDIVIGSESHLPNSVVSRSGTAISYTFNEVVRPTKVTAMALRAKLWVYAASPLYNGGWAEALKLRNPDGTQIFPERDPNKWVTAKQRLEELLTFAQAQGHDLYRTLVNGSINPDASVYTLFQEYNQEILWSATYNSYSDQYKMEKRTNPRDVNACYGTIGPSQESVDMFFMANGLAKDDPASGYNEDALVQVSHYCTNNLAIRTDANVFNMYAAREPRFYADVIYQGKSWHIQPSTGYYVDFSLNGGAGPASTDTPLNGYLLGKFKNRTVNHVSGGVQIWRRVSIIYRLAEFYLYYAEACNEVDPGDPDIIRYLDLVRERAGISGYQKLADEGKKNIIGNYQAQAKAIRHERFVELFCEGQRYFDIRRWMICGPGQEADQTKFTGMNEYGDPTKPIGTPESYYYRTTIERRIWNDRMYLYPIHQNVVNLSKGLIVQNPGW